MNNDNPFHSQDSIFEFTSSVPEIEIVPLSVPPSEIISVTSSDSGSDFDMTGWLQKCSALECCRVNCLQLVPPDFLTEFKMKFKDLNKSQRDVFIKGIMTCCQVVNTQARRKFEYKIYPIGKVCRNALVLLFSMSRQQIQNIINDLNRFKPRVHGHTGIVFPHALTGQQKACIKEWLLEFAELHGEPRPGRQYYYRQSKRICDTTYLWLPSEFTISRLHGIYNQTENAIQVHFETFRRLFHDCEMIKIRSPRSDMCDTCTEFKTQLNGTTTDTGLTQTTEAFTKHLKQAKLARLDYNRSKTLSNVTCLSFDYSQNLCLPSFTDQPSEIYFMSLLNIHLFGIFNETRQKQLNYIYREDQGKKGSNNVTSILIDYIYRLAEQQRKHLVLFADNCVGQNKNNTVMKLLNWLCLTGKCESIEMKFMIKGHTKFSPDSGFGNIKKKYLQSNVYTLAQANDMIQQSSTVNSSKIFPSHRFKDYRSKLDDFFIDISNIGQYHSFVFKHSDPGKAELKRHVQDSHENTTVIDLKKHQGKPNSFYAFEPETLEPPKLTVKKQTDLKRAARYVPAEFKQEYLFQ
eukprot:NODE_471_length_7033_cov_0.382031.p1 type:complete len:574 gc:universal NODE_471_length_7033_cov_0.382031:4047-2326(-)